MHISLDFKNMHVCTDENANLNKWRDNMSGNLFHTRILLCVYISDEEICEE